MKEGGRAGSMGARSHRLRAPLVISELALAAAALIGAGVFVRSFKNAGAINPGFDPDRVLLLRFYLPGYSNDQSRRFCIRLREHLRSVPGISSASCADTTPLGFGGDKGHDIEIRDQ